MSDEHQEQGETRFVPRSIGKYRIAGVLGTGGMGVVYKAHDASIDRIVALKTIRADLLGGAEGAEWRERFKREARAAARCLHPNIVTVFEYGEHDGTAFIAMEYVTGRPLQHFLAEKVRFDQKVAVYLIEQVLDALDYSHAKGVVHRDIKPSNIILVEGARIKVADFGIARIDAVNATQHSALVGTPSYMSPERFSGGEVDERSDLFAVGVVLFELLTGEKPFPGRTTTEVMYNVLHHQPRDVTALNPTVPQALNAVVLRALARDPKARHQKAAEFAAALKLAASAGAAQQGPAAADPDFTVVSYPWSHPGVSTGSDMATGTGVGTGAGGLLPPELLRKAEEHLAFHVGPVARVMVKKAAAEATGIGELYATLARHIPSEPEREVFLSKGRRMAAGGGGTRTGGSLDVMSRPFGATGTGLSTGAGSLPSGLSEPELERARQDLTVVLGPIAQVLVRRTARRASSPGELYQLLADHIPNPQDRTAFLKKAPQR